MEVHHGRPVLPVVQTLDEPAMDLDGAGLDVHVLVLVRDAKLGWGSESRGLKRGLEFRIEEYKIDIDK